MELRNKTEGLTYRIGTVGRLNAGAVEQETYRIWCFALAITEGVHELLQRCCTLDFKEDFIVVVCNFDV